MVHRVIIGIIIFIISWYVIVPFLKIVGVHHPTCPNFNEKSFGRSIDPKLQQKSNCEGCNYFAYGDKLFDEGKYQEALNYYKKSINFHSDKQAYLGFTYHTIAHTYEKLKQWANAEASYQEAINREIYRGENNLCRGKMYYNLGKYEMALGDINTAIKKTTSERDHEAFFYKGMILMKLDRIAESIPVFEKAISICNNPNKIKEYKEHLEIAKNIISRKNRNR